MRQLATATLLGVLTALPARADCPPPPDHTDALTGLIERAQAAPDERSAKLISNRMWELWADAPDTRAQELLDEGMSRREAYDFKGAVVAFDALIAYCPDYAEGYNQRAFVNFIRQDYEGALPDLERALELSPRHIAAMTGQALTLAALDRKAEAALVLREALEMNPWLGERSLLPVLESEEQEL
ncbi:MAG: tetratricopeptide repeat protein [Roseovarius sp.]